MTPIATRRRDRWLVLGLGLVLLVGAWHIAPPLAPPLFDSVCGSDPYHVFHGDLPTATKILQVTDGTLPTTQFSSDSDQQPLAQFLVPTGTLSIPAGATGVKLTIQPVAPPAIAPPDGTLNSNVYRFWVTTSDGRDVTLLGRPTIVLRDMSVSGPRVIEHFDGTSWTRLDDTTPVGCDDTLGATAPALGDYAVVAVNDATASASPGITPLPSSPGPSPVVTGDGSSATLVAVIAVAALFVATVVGMLLIRRRRRSLWR